MSEKAVNITIFLLVAGAMLADIWLFAEVASGLS